MNKILIFYPLLFKKPLIGKLLTICLTVVTCNLSLGVNAQKISKANNRVILYGSHGEINKIGGEYIIFENDKNVSQGLVYVQNSDVFSCFQGIYDSQKNMFEQVSFAYQDMSSGKWVETPSSENLSLIKFPHKLNYEDTNEGVKNLFTQCLNFYQSK